MPPVLTARAAEQKQKAAELAEKYTGWLVWSARKGNAKVATRAGGDPPAAAGETYAATLIADDWNDLEQQLAQQAKYDAERAHLEQQPRPGENEPASAPSQIREIS
jgi:hypothetical protein